MKLLICAQAADKDDTSLSFLLLWITELSRHFESVEVICLKEGGHSLPANVRVHSLGKETARGARFVKRLRYMARLVWFAWSLRHSYDRVHVFQNEEYLLVAGWLWKLLGKPAHLWRNHYDGSFLTHLAASFARKVFYTSRYSYTARFKHAERMPLGIDLTRFSSGTETRSPRSVLFLARMAPSKRAEVLLDAVARLTGSANVSFVGDPLPQDAAYYTSLKELARKNPKGADIRFLPGVPNDTTPEVYRTHVISVNTSRSGMYDKTIFEAAACGCLVLASSKDFAADADPRCVFEDGDAASLALQLETLLNLSESERAALSRKLRDMAERNSLTAFGEKLTAAIV